MRKLTRRSYNRKLIMLGLALFLSVGLISTGFSAWLISSVNDAEADSPVSVGTINTDAVSVTIDQWTPGAEEGTGTWDAEQTLSFDASNTDAELSNPGRVAYSADEGGKPEDLDMLISGKVTEFAKVSKLQMTITLPDSIAAAIAANYIALDLAQTPAAEISDDNKTITVNLPMEVIKNEGVDTKDASFTYTLKFKWGTYFAEANPSVFYDSDTLTVARNLGFGDAGDGKLVTNTSDKKGTEINDAQVISEMTQFRTVLAGNANNVAYTGQIHIEITPILK